MGALQLGPNHPLHGEPLGPASTAGRNRGGRKRKPIVATFVENGPPEGTHYTPTQLLRAYAAAHDRVVGKTCGCLLCSDLRYLLEQARARLTGERHGG